MPSRANSGQVSDWGVNRGEIALGVGGAIDASKTQVKTGLPNVSYFWGATNTVLTQNFYYAFTFIVYDPITVDAYLVRPNAGSASAILTSYIYKMDKNTFLDGTNSTFVTGTNSAIDVTTAGNVTTTLASPVTLNSGFYYVLMHTTVANSPQLWSGAVTNAWMAGASVFSGTNMGGSRAGSVIANTASAPGASVSFTAAASASANVPITLRWT